MGFKLEKTKDYFLLDTRVENMFINEYMVSAPGEYVKVYLFALMYTELGTEFTNEDIAKQLCMEAEDVFKAWTYWEKIGVIRKSNISPENSLEYDVEFVMLKQMLYSNDEEAKPMEIETGIGARMSNREYKEMFEQVEKILGRVMSGSEIGEIFSWINELGTEPEVIEFAFKYCGERNKKSVKYVGAVIKNWIIEGHRSIESVREHVNASEGRMASYAKIFKALGFRRNPTEEEKRIMDGWFDKMSHDIDTVMKACNKTAGISNPNINYVNRVLENWYEEGEPKLEKNAPTAGELANYLDMLREKEEADAEERRREVYRKVPRIKEIEQEEQKLGAGLSRIVVSNQIDKKERIEETKKRIDELNMERALLLTDNGFELDHMEVKYNCPECKDTGMLETGERCQCLNEITREKIKYIMQKN